MLCLSSSAASSLNESVSVSNAESQLAVPLMMTTVFGVSVICSPNGSAVWTGAVAAGGGVAGACAAAGGVAGVAEGLAIGVGVAAGAGVGVSVAAGTGVAGVLAAGGAAGGDCAQIGR